mmetsp:Transcript_77415/g.127961  ORF Transcript_77415/g.127961 Transcript_77415/m.127961 type:complete len:101 (-) Transcript_77415:19-321(-)
MTSSRGRSAMDFAQEASQKDICCLLHEVLAQEVRKSRILSGSSIERGDVEQPVKDRRSAHAPPVERRDAAPKEEERSDGKGRPFGNLESLLQEPVSQIDL